MLRFSKHDSIGEVEYDLNLMQSIEELVQLGNTEVDTDVFIWRLQRKIFDSADSQEARTKNVPSDKHSSADADLKPKSLTKLKNLDKELRFITGGYFDFDEMIWKDRSDGRVLNSSDWYENVSYYLRKGLNNCLYQK